MTPNTQITPETVGMLKAGDWVADGPVIGRLKGQADGWGCATLIAPNGSEFSRILHRNAFTYIGPDLGDGWIGWGGGENPVPRMRVEVKTRGSGNLVGDAASEDWGRWWERGDCDTDIIAFRPALSPPAEGEVDIEPMNMGLVRSAVYGVITDAVFGALKAEGEVVTGDYGRVWDACNEAAEALMNGKCPQVSAPDRPYTDAFATPTPAPIDWTVAGPKLVEALEIIAAAKRQGTKTPMTYAGGFDAGCDWASGVAERALAAAQPQSNGE